MKQKLKDIEDVSWNPTSNRSSRESTENTITRETVEKLLELIKIDSVPLALSGKNEKDMLNSLYKMSEHQK